MSNKEIRKAQEPVSLNFPSDIVRGEIGEMLGVNLKTVRSEEGDFGHKKLWRLDDSSMTVIHYPGIEMLIVGVSDSVGGDIRAEIFQELREKYGESFFSDDNLGLEKAPFSIRAWGKEENRDLVSKAIGEMYLMESQRTSFEELGGREPNPFANLAIRAMSRRLKKVATADPTEQSTADIDYRTVAELLTQ